MASSREERLPSAQEYVEAASVITRFQKELRGRISVQSIPFEQHCFDPEQGRPSSRAFYRSRSCYIGYVLTVVERDGTVWGCVPEATHGEPLGNIHQTSFREIWMNSEAFQRLRDTDGYQGKCGRCEFRKVCGGCRARAYEISGDYMAEEPYCIYEPI